MGTHFKTQASSSEIAGQPQLHACSGFAWREASSSEIAGQPQRSLPSLHRKQKASSSEIAGQPQRGGDRPHGVRQASSSEIAGQPQRGRRVGMGREKASSSEIAGQPQLLAAFNVLGTPELTAATFALRIGDEPQGHRNFLRPTRVCTRVAGSRCFDSRWWVQGSIPSNLPNLAKSVARCASACCSYRSHCSKCRL